MQKLYDTVKQKFDNNFKTKVVRSTLEFKDNKIYFMKDMEVNVVCDGKRCILNTIHGKIDANIEDLDFDEQVKIVTNCIFILVDIISLATETSLNMLTSGLIGKALFDITTNKKEKEILN